MCELRRTFGKFILVVIATELLAWSCGEDSTKPEEKKQVFEGILETDAFCNIIGGDTTDFQPRAGPGEPEIMSLKYACPNPAVGRTTTIYWAIPTVDSVWILAFDRPGGLPVDTIYNRTDTPGVHSKEWSYDGPAGIYRVVMHTESGFTSYGDIKFED